MSRVQRAYNVRYYRANRTAELARVRSRQRATIEFLRSLRRVPCCDCESTFEPFQMDFDHRSPHEKAFRLTSGRATLMARDRLVHEAAKCDVVCANCHRVRTARRAVQAADSGTVARTPPRWHAQAQLLRDLRSVPCADCHSTFPTCVMDFDHRDPRTKRYTVSRMIGRAGRQRIALEVAKCDIVCANCHRARTYSRSVAASLQRE